MTVPTKPLIKWQSDFYSWQHIKEDFFRREDYISLASDVNLVRIDPDIAKSHMYAANGIKFPGDFVLYQCDCPSEIRRNLPMRFFHSQEFGKAYELKGSNEPFYRLMEFISREKTLAEGIALWQNNHHNLWNYVKAFFDNVKGQHGRFYLVNDLAEVENRIDTFYWYDFKNNPIKPARQQRFADCEIAPFSEAMAALLNNHNEYSYISPKDSTNDVNDKKGTVVFSKVFIVFKDSLFKVAINLELSPNLGVLEITDETQIDAAYFKQLSIADG